MSPYDRPLGQAIERDLGEQSPRLRPCKSGVEFVRPSQRDAAMLAAMPQPDKPVVVPTRPDAQAKARKFAIPDAVFGLAQRQLAPREVAIEQSPAPGLSPEGDHMAIIVSTTAPESRGITAICGDLRATIGMPAAKQLQHVTH